MPRPASLLLPLLLACGDSSVSTPSASPDPRPAAPPPSAAAGPPAARYTSLGASDCSRADAAEGAGVVATCGGLGGYGVRVESHDHGSELDLTRGGRALGLRYEAPGWMADVTDGKIEWRARGDAAPHALIFRVKWVDSSSGTNEPRSTLIVTRLDGGTVCEIGRTTSNESAREMADDSRRGCA